MELQAGRISSLPKEARRDVQSLILDAAETVFAQRGFDGATTRAIAELAEVNLGLIHYHFSNKELLFERAVERRVEAINGRRYEMLQSVRQTPEGATLERVFEALMRPPIEFGADQAESSNYARIIVQIASGLDERSIRLTSRFFDDIAREFIGEIEACVPGLSHEQATWAYMHAISIGMFLIARTGRVVALSGGACREDELEATIARAITFVSAGTRALTEDFLNPFSRRK